jgi:hypothetical protein
MRALSLVGCLVALVACGSDPLVSDGATAGASGVSPAAGAGGAAASGGAGAGTAGSGGSAGDPCAPGTCTSMEPCEPVTVDDGVITDFSGLDGNVFRESSGEWWLRFFGGSYVYPALDECSTTTPATLLEQDVGGEELHVTGTVGTWSGFGLWFAPCLVDLSSYSGITFTLSGDASPNESVKVYLLTATNLPPSTDPRNPTCTPNVATCVPDDPDNAGASCTAASSLVSIGTTPQTYELAWNELTGGRPDDLPDPSEVMGILFELEWNGGWASADEYSIDLVLDDVALLP